MLLDYLEYVSHATGLSRVFVPCNWTIYSMCLMLLDYLEYVSHVTGLSRVCVSCYWTI